MKRIKEAGANKSGLTLLELVVMIAILAVVGSVAVIKINKSLKNTYIIQEKALLVSLSKAAINYNAANDSWYGMTLSEDIFNGLLDNPPPHRNFNDDLLSWMGWSTDRKTWKLNFTPGPPPQWLIACPHHYGFFANFGSSWSFYPESGKIEPWYGSWPGASFHRWP